MANPLTFPAKLTLLTATNTLLRSIGEAPVADVTPPIGAVDVEMAVATIEEVDLSVQSEGWSFNREFKYSLALDSDSHLLLPDNVLRVSTAYWSDQTPVEGITERGGKLYDPYNGTDEFTEAMQVDMVVRLDFSDIPEVAKRYIVTRAAQLFQGRQQSSSMVDRIEDREVARSRAVLEQHEDEVAGPHNSITGNAGVGKALCGRGVRRRY